MLSDHWAGGLKATKGTTGSQQLACLVLATWQLKRQEFGAWSGSPSVCSKGPDWPMGSIEPRDVA